MNRQPVAFLYVAKRRRDARRERVAAVLVSLILSALLPALFILGSN